MSKPDLSIEPKLIESAKEEFLQKGFEAASLKDICEKAGVTTGALYKRYGGKEELFCAVVKKTVEELETYRVEKAAQDIARLSDEELVEAWNMENGNMVEWFQFLYARYDAFVLLLSRAQGTRYSNFQHEWCELMSELSYSYYREARQRNLTEEDITEKELHVWLSAYWTAVYEPFIHHFTWEEILIHNKSMSKMFNWQNLMNFKEIKGEEE